MAYSSGHAPGIHVNYHAALTALLPFIRVVLQRGDRRQRRIVRFLLREAKAMKMVVPPIPQVPAKPFARKVKKKAATISIPTEGPPKSAADAPPAGAIGPRPPIVTTPAIAA